MSSKIIRSLCYFSENPGSSTLERLDYLANIMAGEGFAIQTRRICSPNILEMPKGLIGDGSLLKSAGTLELESVKTYLKELLSSGGISFNLDLSGVEIEDKHVEVLFEIIKNDANKTFNFAYVFNNVPSSPFFPSANYEKEGFSIGLQATDLAESCANLDQWLEKMRQTWIEIVRIFTKESDFLGIDSSVASLLEGKSSLINFIKKVHHSFNDSVLTDTYLKITKFIKERNPKPVGLCGLMLPCLEDFELAKEYEKGNFSIERNMFISLHSGLGIDTYPIGVDEKRSKILNILKVIQGLSNKYKKPFSVRFVSDGEARIGEKANFCNQYLKDVVIAKL